jgi:hypothetical protein
METKKVMEDYVGAAGEILMLIVTILKQILFQQTCNVDTITLPTQNALHREHI